MDLRRQRSREKLQNALIEELKHKRLADITIGQLVKVAGVSRQTFYSNFDDLNEILCVIAKDLFSKSETRIAAMSAEEKVVDLPQIFRYLLEEIDTNKRVMQVVFSVVGTSQLLGYFESLVDLVVAKSDSAANGEETPWSNAMIAGALIALTSRWVAMDAPSLRVSELSQLSAKLGKAA